MTNQIERGCGNKYKIDNRKNQERKHVQVNQSLRKGSSYQVPANDIEQGSIGQTEATGYFAIYVSIFQNNKKKEFGREMAEENDQQDIDILFEFIL
jgi:hypothetical protein